MIEIKKVIEKNFSEFKVYNEEQEQAFKKPYFFVKILNSNENKELNSRYKRSVSFEISYVSDNKNINEEYLNMADKLYELLEIIQMKEKKYRALNMKHEVENKILQFMFQLNFNIMKKNEENKMNKLEVDVHGK